MQPHIGGHPSLGLQKARLHPDIPVPDRHDPLQRRHRRIDDAAQTGIPQRRIRRLLRHHQQPQLQAVYGDRTENFSGGLPCQRR